jgi:hypothetical protein
MSMSMYAYDNMYTSMHLYVNVYVCVLLTFMKFISLITHSDYFGRLHQKLGQADYNKLLAGVLGSREPLPKELWMRTAGVEGDLEDEDENEDLSEFFEREQLCANLLHIPANLDHSGEMVGLCRHSTIVRSCSFQMCRYSKIYISVML